jgi:predicted HTH domain antitoxin
MHAVKVYELKNNPSEALRQAKKAPVIIMKGDEPTAVMVHLDDDSLLSRPGVKMALATALFKDGSLALGRAARLADVSLVGFIQHPSRLGIPAIRGKASEAKADLETLNKWLASS